MNDLSEFSVARTIVVNVSQERAFDVFVHQIGSWWDLTGHILGESPAQTAIVEPAIGGRWFEIDKNGTECDWGRVISYEPNRRIVLDWQITPDWKFDPNLHTEVEVQFIEVSSTTTRVDVVHRGLEEYGERAASMRGLFESDGGWSDVLAHYANAGAFR